jgi:hypothetical protein
MLTQCNSGTAPKSTRRRPRRDTRPAPIALPEVAMEATYLDFPALGAREVKAAFDGGDISSDGGALLLRQVEQATGMVLIIEK